jgi:hypothetical protein
LRVTDFKPGWTVVGNDDRKVGIVRRVGHNYIVTSRSAFTADLYVPVTSIANVENDTIYLNITQPDADHMGWEQEPRDDEAEDSADGDLHRHI